MSVEAKKKAREGSDRPTRAINERCTQDTKHGGNRQARNDRDEIESLKRDRTRMVAELESAGGGVNGEKVRCPFHDDKRASASIFKADDGACLFKCHTCDFKPMDVIAVVRRSHGCDFPHALAHFGISNGNGVTTGRKAIEAVYDYRDESGAIVHQTVRYKPKGYRQRRPDGKGGHIWNLRGIKTVLYRLRELRASDLSEPVYVVEGEKDADRLASSGCVATCNPMGAGKWKADYNEHLRGRRVFVLPDNDEPGRKHAAKVAKSLHGVAADVRIVELPDLPDKGGDVSDWLDGGNSTDELRKLAEAAAVYEPGAAGGGGECEGVETTRHVDDDVIVELAYSVDDRRVCFLVYDRKTRSVTMADSHNARGVTLVPPQKFHKIVTDGVTADGAVLVPTGADFTDCDDAAIRVAVRAFIERYVELPGDCIDVAVEYVMLTWCYDRFGELPYMAFRTADCGCGKSRALDVIGSLAYLPLFVGGGSSASATLRMLDTFKGTLIADEFDLNHATELGQTLAQILNQGFQSRRPLLKCTGEDNTPRAFSCFGPKVFAFRKGLGDDATESRTISIHMKPRTREDIPIHLPREQFDLEALALRNRLLAWRFRNLDRVRLKPELADAGLEDRGNQIGLPLLSIAQDDATRERIVGALRAQQADVAQGRADTFAGLVFDVILDLYDPMILDQAVTPGEVAKEINHRRAIEIGVVIEHLKKPTTPHAVGKIIRTILELPKVPKVKKGARYILDPDRMDRLRRQYSPDGFSGTAPSSLSAPQAGNREYLAGNDDSAGAVAHALSSPSAPVTAPDKPRSEDAIGDSDVGAVGALAERRTGERDESNELGADRPTDSTAIEQLDLIQDGGDDWTGEHDTDLEAFKR